LAQGTSGFSAAKLKAVLREEEAVGEIGDAGKKNT